MVELVAKRYAKALMEIEAGKKIESLIDALESIALVLKEHKAKEIIASPLVSSEDKVALITEALGKKSDPILLQLIKVMGEKDRLGLIPDLVEILKFEKKKESNSFVGEVESSNALEKAELKSLEKALSKHSGAKIKLKQIESDLNGVKVKVEDLGLELSFSKDRVKRALLDHIQKAL